MKHIVSVTGTRADYGIYRPVYQAIQASNDLRLSLLVTGMHLLPDFGSTVEEIKKDGLSIAAEIHTMTDADTHQATAEFVGRSIVEDALVLHDLQPDVVLLLGDRGEQLAAAIAAAELAIPIAHLHGGELSGTIDDAVRHAITHFSTLHLPSTESHANRIRQLKPNTPEDHICVVGAPALDVIRTFSPIPLSVLMEDTPFIPKHPTVIVVQHPDPTDAVPVLQQIESTMQALMQYRWNVLLIGSNADAGGRSINTLLQKMADEQENWLFTASLPHQTFLSWLAAADALVGNSSCGIIEAASFHLPVVNIGQRQQGRLCSGNTIDVPVYDQSAIKAALSTVVEDDYFRDGLRNCTNVYGDGRAAQRVLDALHRL